MNQNTAGPVTSQGSLQRLVEFLREIVTRPAEFIGDAAILDALRSQGALAKYSNETRDLRPMSLNHQKKLAVASLGSFDPLNRLRRDALNALLGEKTRTRRGNTQTREGMLARIRELEADKTALLQDLFLLQRAFDHCRVQARNYAKQAGKTTEALCSKEQRELDVSLSLRSRPSMSGSVPSLADRRKER